MKNNELIIIVGIIILYISNISQLIFISFDFFKSFLFLYFLLTFPDSISNKHFI